MNKFSSRHYLYKNKNKVMKNNLLLIIVLGVILFGFCICAAPLATAMPLNYFGTITLLIIIIWILEEIFWNYLESDDKENNDETKN